MGNTKIPDRLLNNTKIAFFKVKWNTVYNVYNIFGTCRLMQRGNNRNWLLVVRQSRSGLHNIRPAGHMRPARSFLAARENSVAENIAKARLRIITCPFRISSTLPRNRLLRPAASICWSIRPFELSELCRPDLEQLANVLNCCEL